MKTLGYLVLGIAVGSFAVPAYADRERNDSGHGRHKYERQVGKGGEFKEEFRDGNCKVKRELKRDGSYEEERKCEGPGRHVGKGGEFKEEYWDGNCKVKRKLERDGSYEEERKCDGPARHVVGYPAPHPQPGVVIHPPSVVIQPPAVVIK